MFSTGNNSEGVCNKIFGLFPQKGIVFVFVFCNIGFKLLSLLNEISVTGEYTLDAEADDIFSFLL